MDKTTETLRTLAAVPGQIRILAQSCDGDIELLLELSLQHQTAVRLVKEVESIVARAARPVPSLEVVR
jgi:hypothetical protein